MTRRVGIKTGGSRFIHLADMIAISMVMPFAGILRNVFSLIMETLQVGQNFFRGFAQINAQMVDQLQLALFVDLCKQRHFRISRATLHQCATRVITYATQYRCADTGRTDHGVRLTA